MKRLLLLLLLAGPCAAEPATPAPVNPIHWPIPPAPPAPPAPSPVSTLAADQLFVIGLDATAFVLASPPGIVSVVTEAGPVKIRAKFVDGPDRMVCRTFTNKAVAVIEPLTAGKAEILIVLPDGTTDRRLLDVGGPAPVPPVPPVPPIPPVPPVPPQPPAPIPGIGLRVLIVYDPAQLGKMPAAQKEVLYAQGVRDYLNAKAALGPDGKTHEARFWPVDIDASAEAQLWQDAFKRPRASVPWIVVSDGKTGFEGPLPGNVDDTLSLLKKYGG